LDASPLWGLLDQYYTHGLYDRLCASGKEFYFNTMCLQTHALTVFSPDINPAIASLYAQRRFENYDQFLRALLASACQPVLLPPVRILPQEEPMRQYIDAGPREYAGIEMAIAAGATEVFVLLQSPVTSITENREYNDIFSILQETLDIFTADAANNLHILPNLYNEGLRYIQDVKKKIMQQGIPAALIEDWFDTGRTDNPFYNKRPVQLHIIRPGLPLGGGPDGLSFEPTLMQEMLAKGEQAMEAHLALDVRTKQSSGPLGPTRAD
ncbi:MAG TPA: patatin-like phospholipase family protein, partial [Puia sp.]